MGLFPVAPFRSFPFAPGRTAPGAVRQLSGDSLSAKAVRPRA